MYCSCHAVFRLGDWDAIQGHWSEIPCVTFLGIILHPCKISCKISCPILTVYKICVAAHKKGSDSLLLFYLRHFSVTHNVLFVPCYCHLSLIDRVQLEVMDLRCGSLRRGESSAPLLEIPKISKEVFSLLILCVWFYIMLLGSLLSSHHASQLTSQLVLCFSAHIMLLGSLLSSHHAIQLTLSSYCASQLTLCFYWMTEKNLS